MRTFPRTDGSGHFFVLLVGIVVLLLWALVVGRGSAAIHQGDELVIDGQECVVMWCSNKDFVGPASYLCCAVPPDIPPPSQS